MRGKGQKAKGRRQKAEVIWNRIKIRANRNRNKRIGKEALL
jgi:hypothetical protein